MYLSNCTHLKKRAKVVRYISTRQNRRLLKLRNSYVTIAGANVLQPRIVPGSDDRAVMFTMQFIIKACCLVFELVFLFVYSLCGVDT